MQQPRLVFSMRDSMPQFVSCLRTLDEWKRVHAKRADAIAQAEFDANAKHIKSPFARSLHIDDLVRFVDDTVLDINFMVQLPSIERCLEQWWELYAKGKTAVDQDVLRVVYYDLAFVLVEAKTEMIHKNAVAMIMRASWTKWSTKEPPLSQTEFFRLLFVLAHLMTTTNRLGDYVMFFHETFAKIRRQYQSKHLHTQVKARKPRMRRKSTLDEILKRDGSGSSSTGAVLSSSQLAANMQRTSSVTGSTLSVKMKRVQTQSSSASRCMEDEPADRFVEILERTSRGQTVVIDPLLHDPRFQQKWSRPSGVAATAPMQTLVAVQHPLMTTTFYPPMFISRVRTTSSSAVVAASTLRSSQSAPVFTNDTPSSLSEQHDRDILRRSLSRVTLKQRIDATRALAEQQQQPSASSLSGQQRQRVHPQDATEPLYLAIST